MIEPAIMGHAVLTSLTHCPRRSEFINLSLTCAEKLRLEAGRQTLPATRLRYIFDQNL